MGAIPDIGFTGALEGRKIVILLIELIVVVFVSLDERIRVADFDAITTLHKIIGAGTGPTYLFCIFCIFRINPVAGGAISVISANSQVCDIGVACDVEVIRIA